MSLCRSVKLVLAATVGAALFTSGCADDGASLHVLCAVAPTATGTECEYTPDGSSCVVEGVMNLAVATRYLAGVAVQSGLKARQREVPPMAEPNGIQLRSAEIELRTTAGNPIAFGPGLPNPFEVKIAGYVAPRGSALAALTLIPPAYAKQLRAAEKKSTTALGQIVAAVKIKGETDGKVEVETDEWTWPVRLSYVSPALEDAQCTPVEETVMFCGDQAGLDSVANLCLCSKDNAGCAPIE